PVLDVLLPARYLVQLPRREHRGPGDAGRLDLSGRLVPVGEPARDHRVRAAGDAGVGVAGPAPDGTLDSAQIRFRAAVQQPRLPGADVRALEIAGRERADPVLAAGALLRDADARRVVPVADRLVDGNQTGAVAAGRLRDGRLVPVTGSRRESFGAFRQPHRRQWWHDRRIRAFRFHFRILAAAGRRRVVAADLAAGQPVDARRSLGFRRRQFVEDARQPAPFFGAQLFQKLALVAACEWCHRVVDAP